MHTHSIEPWQHGHIFLGQQHDRHERRTWFVVALTSVMMVAEIVGGHHVRLYGGGRRRLAYVDACRRFGDRGSGLPICAQARARSALHFRHRQGRRLAAFTSAVILALIALVIGYEAAMRLASPVAIDFVEATWLAVFGLGVNLASAWLLSDHGPSHGHGHHHHGHDHGHHHHKGHDTNIRAAYVHVLADAMTSVLAIAGLLAGRYFGWVWMDSAAALIGVVVILSWSAGLLRTSGTVLLDMEPDGHLAGHIRKRLEIEGDRVCDLHLWRLGPATPA